jgi:endonuclease/exonuclease/phosphatase family metal-dependent hydrolase
MGRLALVLFAALVVCRFGGGSDDDDVRPLRIATFNIEDFPKDERQIAGAFAEIAQLDAAIVGLQEIMDPTRFVTAARARLGAHVDVVFEPFVELGYRHNGLLYDTRAFELVSTRMHDDTRIGGRHKAVLEVRLRPRAGGSIIRAFVVHLRSGTEGRPTRAKQHAALASVVQRATASGERVVVLGDFNATDDMGDRADLASLARTAGLFWSTESLACTAFWRRRDGCPRSRLDHVITWRAARPSVAGACASEGCNWQDACPIYREHVSDHCPVIVELDAR